MTVKVRRARPSDAEQLSALAHAAKRHWGYPARWIRLWQEDLTVKAKFIKAHPVYSAVRDRKVIGFYALSHRGAEFELEHMWVHPEHIGSGVGRILFRHALAAVRAKRGAVLKIASDPNAEGFYRRLGARRAAEVPSKPAGRRLPLLVFRLRPAPRRPGKRLERARA